MGRPRAAIPAGPGRPRRVSDDRLIDAGRRVLRLESDAVRGVEQRLDGRFTRAIELLKASTGRVIVTGVGKSGIIARKIAATLTSTGTPASWIHPVDSLHGDLGLIGPRDIAIVLSKSGETDELGGLLGELQRMQVPVIALTGVADSMLGRAATVVLECAVSEEACPHDLAPTSSTTAALALGDALAVVLLEEKGFKREDFARLHPGGRLGRKLLLRARDVMIPPGALLAPDATMREAVMLLAHQRGLAMIAREGRLSGVLTAGDLSRLAERHTEVLTLQVDSVMTRTPKRCGPDEFAAAVVGQMERAGVMALPVVTDEDRIVGVVHLHDLMRAGAV
ncbi:MAG: KpsF/GutQ family sugar-phosphate isomerase [Gemmatimonadales bacterium]|nr:KpsF/GutQ family sugar-phosphate isomerase [Gemmatimonadales bacterium]